jgi:hypothetical protein
MGKRSTDWQILFSRIKTREWLQALSTGVYNTRTRYMLLKGEATMIWFSASSRPSQEIGTKLPGIGVDCPCITPRYVINMDESGDAVLRV